MRGSRKFFQRGSTFLVDNGDTGSKYRYKWDIEMAFHWWADDAQTLNAGLVTL